MSRRRPIYETAFDCKLSKSNDDLEILDKMTNHPVLFPQVKNGSLIQLSSQRNSFTEPTKEICQKKENPPTEDHLLKLVVLQSKNIFLTKKQELTNFKSQKHHYPSLNNITKLSQNVKTFHINSNDEKGTLSYALPSQLTTTMSKKFEDCEHSFINTIQSELKSEKHFSDSSESNTLKIKDRPVRHVFETKERIKEFKGRPKELIHKIRPRSFVRESKSIIKLKDKSRNIDATSTEMRHAFQGHQNNLLEIKLRANCHQPSYSSTESITTNSSVGSIESLQSSNSEGNYSSNSSESRPSTSLSSHSSDSENTHYFRHCSRQKHLRLEQSSNLSDLLTQRVNKLHVLSPISDKSSQEPASEILDDTRKNNLDKFSTKELKFVEINSTLENETSSPSCHIIMTTDSLSKKRRNLQNKKLVDLAFPSSLSGDTEFQGSDSGISIESRGGIKYNKPLNEQQFKSILQLNFLQQHSDKIIQQPENEQELSDLPFDMPKLRRRRLFTQQQDITTSGSATSIDLKDLPFDMPKLKRRLRCIQNTESSISHASSTYSIPNIKDHQLSNDDCSNNFVRSKMILQLNGDSGHNNEISGDVNVQLSVPKPSIVNLELSLKLVTSGESVDFLNIQLPLDKQSWYHGSITRIEAEAVLRLSKEGSYLVRNSESTKQDYLLSLKSARGFMHMRIQKNEESNAYILGQFSKPFQNIPEIIRHFSINRLPIRGAEHMCLLYPVVAQLL